MAILPEKNEGRDFFESSIVHHPSREVVEESAENGRISHPNPIPGQLSRREVIRIVTLCSEAARDAVMAAGGSEDLALEAEGAVVNLLAYADTYKSPVQP